MHDVTHLGHGDQKSFAGYCRKTVESVHESRGKRRHGAEMPEEFGVLPSRFTRGTYTPGSDRIFQVRHGRQQGHLEDGRAMCAWRIRQGCRECC
jgi:hypothetical protein